MKPRSAVRASPRQTTQNRQAFQMRTADVDFEDDDEEPRSARRNSGTDATGKRFARNNSVYAIFIFSVASGAALIMLLVLGAILLPAIQGAREAARRTQARNNLKKLSEALHYYHDAQRVFPTGGDGLETIGDQD